MDTMFLKSENSKSSEPYRLLFNLEDKMDLTRSDKHIVLSNFNIYYTWKKYEKYVARKRSSNRC